MKGEGQLERLWAQAVGIIREKDVLTDFGPEMSGRDDLSDSGH